MAEQIESESNVNAPSRVRRFVDWLKRPRTVRTLAPAGLILGVGLAALGVLMFPGGGVVPVGSPLGNPLSGSDEPTTGITGEPGIAYRVPSESVEGVPYLVPPEEVSAGFRLVVDSIDVNAMVIRMGVDENDVPEVPYNAGKVAWYDFSATPGTGSNAVLAGHVRWAGDHGVFAELDEVEAGDVIRLKWEDGSESVYQVFDNVVVDASDPASLMVMAPTPVDTITLITCGGTFVADAGNPLGGDFTHRSVVKARLVEPSVASLSR